MFGIATNVARNTRRAARRYEDALSRMPRAAPIPDFADEIVDRMQAVRDAYGSLRRGEREVFALCAWAGLDHAEAAEALGVAVGTVRSRLSRARRKLEKLAEERQRAPGWRQEEDDRRSAVRSAKEEKE